MADGTIRTQGGISVAGVVQRHGAGTFRVGFTRVGPGRQFGSVLPPDSDAPASGDINALVGGVINYVNAGAT